MNYKITPIYTMKHFLYEYIKRKNNASIYLKLDYVQPMYVLKLGRLDSPTFIDGLYHEKNLQQRTINRTEKEGMPGNEVTNLGQITLKQNF